MKNPKKLCFFKTCLIGFLSLFTSITQAQYQQELVLRFNDDVSEASIDTIRNEFNATEIGITPISRVRLWYLDSIIYIPENDTLFFLIGSDTLDIKESVKRARSKTKVKSVGENFFTKIFPPETNDTLGHGPTGNPTLCTPPQPITCPPGTCNVKIGVIDTGVDPSNAFVKTWLSPTLGYNFVDRTPYPIDGHGHGTHVIGAIAQMAQMVGTNLIEIVPIKSQDDTGAGTVYAAIEGLDYAIMHELDIVNMSLGYIGERPDTTSVAPKPMPLEYVIELAGSMAGTLVVCAAGNESKDIDHTIEGYYPAGFDSPNLIAVASNDCSRNLYNFSNYGMTSVDLAAPGAVHSPWLNNYWSIKVGTSMSSAIVSGAAGLLSTVACFYNNNQEDYIRLKHAILMGVDFANLPLLTRGVLNTPQALQYLLPLLRKQDLVQKNSLNNLLIYPQPFDGFVNIEWESTQDNNSTISVFDALGQKVFEQQQGVLKGLNSIKWQTNELSQGTYWLMINSGKERITKKMIKLK